MRRVTRLVKAPWVYGAGFAAESLAGKKGEQNESERVGQKNVVTKKIGDENGAENRADSQLVRRDLKNLALLERERGNTKGKTRGEVKDENRPFTGVSANVSTGDSLRK
jgi:hypothetical protein